MPAPPIFRDRLVATLTRLLPRMVDRIWDAAEASRRALDSRDPNPLKSEALKQREREERVIAIAQQAGQAIVKSSKFVPRQPRLRQGEARRAVLQLISSFPEDGISRGDIRKKIPGLLRGAPISENTLKRCLMDLREKQRIFTKNSAWFPSDVGLRETGKSRSSFSHNVDEADDDDE